MFPEIWLLRDCVFTPTSKKPSVFRPHFADTERPTLVHLVLFKLRNITFGMSSNLNCVYSNFSTKKMKHFGYNTTVDIPHLFRTTGV